MGYSNVPSGLNLLLLSYSRQGADVPSPFRYFISYIVKLSKQQLQGAANAQQQLRNLPDDDKLNAVFFSLFFFFFFSCFMPPGP